MRLSKGMPDRAEGRFAANQSKLSDVKSTKRRIDMRSACVVLRPGAAAWSDDQLAPSSDCAGRVDDGISIERSLAKARIASPTSFG